MERTLRNTELRCINSELRCINSELSWPNSELRWINLELCWIWRWIWRWNISACRVNSSLRCRRLVSSITIDALHKGQHPFLIWDKQLVWNLWLHVVTQQSLVPLIISRQIAHESSSQFISCLVLSCLVLSCLVNLSLIVAWHRLMMICSGQKVSIF